MYKGLFLIFGLLFSIGIPAQEFQFEKETIDYGKIKKNANGVRVFVFKNTGNQPIIITNIQSSCGCTVAERPEKPIMPNEKGTIKISYDTKKIGGFSKVITIFSNAKNARKRLRIKGYVTKNISLKKEKSILSEN
jgi:hypothetical protein